MTDDRQSAYNSESRHNAESRRDVEKSWHDPAAARAATRFTIAVVVVACAVMGGAILWSVSANHGECDDASFAVCQSPQRYILAMAPTAIFLAGGVIAFVQSFRTWRAGGAWPIWQGAGWVLFVLSLLYLGLSSPALIVD
jgi:hypothetical protein